MLVENPQSFDAEIAQRILANPPYIRGQTVLFRFYLNAVYEFVPEFLRNENPVSKPAQSLADQLFVGLVSVAFGSVEKRYPALDSLAHKSHGHFFIWVRTAVVVQPLSLIHISEPTRRS